MAKHSEAIQGTEKEFLDEFQKLCYSRSSWQVWADLMAAMACSISNVADRSPEHYESREKEYAQCIERLGSVEVPAKMLAIIVEALERNPEQDFLGAMYMQLNLGNHWKGQFFTPYCVCKMMSEITCEDVDSHIEKQGYLPYMSLCFRRKDIPPFHCSEVLSCSGQRFLSSGSVYTQIQPFPWMSLYKFRTD